MFNEYKLGIYVYQRFTFHGRRVLIPFNSDTLVVFSSLLSINWLSFKKKQKAFFVLASRKALYDLAMKFKMFFFPPHVTPRILLGRPGLRIAR